MQDVEDDLLAAYRAAGASKPVKNSALSPSGITLRKYKAFVAENASRSSLLLLKSGLVKKAAADVALPYSYITKVNSDGYGFGFSLVFSLPSPSGAMVVEIRGSGLTPLLDGILNGTVRSVQVFDPERFIAPAEGDFDREADEWRGPAVVKEIAITDKRSPEETTVRH